MLRVRKHHCLHSLFSVHFRLNLCYLHFSRSPFTSVFRLREEALDRKPHSQANYASVFAYSPSNSLLSSARLISIRALPSHLPSATDPVASAKGSVRAIAPSGPPRLPFLSAITLRSPFMCVYSLSLPT